MFTVKVTGRGACVLSEHDTYAAAAQAADRALKIGTGRGWAVEIHDDRGALVRGERDGRGFRIVRRLP